jgi:hypothetical protein
MQKGVFAGRGRAGTSNNMDQRTKAGKLMKAAASGQMPKPKKQK